MVLFQFILVIIMLIGALGFLGEKEDEQLKMTMGYIFLITLVANVTLYLFG